MVYPRDLCGFCCWISVLVFGMFDFRVRLQFGRFWGSWGHFRRFGAVPRVSGLQARAMRAAARLQARGCEPDAVFGVFLGF